MHRTPLGLRLAGDAARLRKDVPRRAVPARAQALRAQQEQGRPRTAGTSANRAGEQSTRQPGPA
eukprot:8743699-Alexandrium_andersonii.AAC.1